MTNTEYYSEICLSFNRPANIRFDGRFCALRYMNMVARIYRPAKTAMQSGKAKTEAWFLEYEPEVARKIEPLMGYTSSRDMKSQIRMSFESLEEAIAYAQKYGIAYRIEEPKEAKRRKVSYTDNFRFDRQQPWTH
ncbi:ETC complex I subunit [Pseudochrobactrum saccharolyticum]|nr:ETC complex I subunit [Pseudochrobactrum saccharolyticum]